jgi:arylsulfatase A-like enzyme
VNQPNIVFIMADDLGYADVSCNGQRDYSTPNIDRIAERGVRLRQGYANSAVCSATRLALITGRYQYRLPLGLEEPLAGKTDVGLPPDHPTLPSLLRRAGYGTTLIGKWHLGVLPKFGPLQSGYDHFWGIRSGAIDYYSHKNPRGEDDLWDGDATIQQTGYLTDLLGGRAVDAIEAYAKRGQPFLLSLHFNAPHWPWEAPGDQAESDRLLGTRLRHFDGGTQQTYARMVQAMDLQIGRVLQALDANGLSNNTIVLFTSDNGGERFSDTWPFTGIKTELLEGGLRVPALICWPARIKAGGVSDQVAITMDWFPTLLEAAAVAPEQDHPPDGISLLPMLAGQSDPAARTLFWRYRSNAQRAMRDGDFKYLKIQENTFLFNVMDDPRERANLKHSRQDVFDRMETDWRAWNATMLPEIEDSFGEVYTAADLADHIGSR